MALKKNQSTMDGLSIQTLAEMLLTKITAEGTASTDDRGKIVDGFLTFNSKEISKMPTKFKRIMTIEGNRVRCRIRSDKKSVSIELRYRRRGYNISVSATTAKEAKERFIEKIRAIEEGSDVERIPTNFDKFAHYYFDNFRIRQVSEATFKRDMMRYNKYIKPTFGGYPLKQITDKMIQDKIDEISAEGLQKTAEEIYCMLNILFKRANAYRIRLDNPVELVIPPEHYRENGQALTYEEEIFLLSQSRNTPYFKIFALALFTGLRPNEYATARIEDGFIVAVNSKRKGKKKEWKKIPITPMLSPFVKKGEDFDLRRPEAIRIKLKEILPNHKLYDLRTTFYTRCRECGVADVARDEFVGHSGGKLVNAYTDLSDDFLKKEGKKLDYWDKLKNAKKK